MISVALCFNRVGVLNTVGPRSVTSYSRVKGNLPEVAGASHWIPLSHDMMGPSNRVGWSPWLGPAMGVTTTTSGVGMETWVTLHACGWVTGQGAAFPLVVTHFDWVGGLMGATV